MSVSNAKRWAELCQQQAELIDNLTRVFPERSDEHAHLSDHWREVGRKITEGEVVLMPKLR
ncbi:MULTISPECIES: hypothetical protein [Shewanella]|uniref:Uncharacterized protein n=1 Tax=Shewanella piezotolerans (strain WP3 / JCM 13877) TaxID=225849 RepID=B8CT66_SHEPW|nr:MULTISPECIES: hypothetical protein [Shewanella]ACJ30842.1 Conserved hypothetical protein [Shewanella piezotolerans WP3]MCL1092428.1 hypothetical protein [Shewanella kaireitica]